MHLGSQEDHLGYREIQRKLVILKYSFAFLKMFVCKMHCVHARCPWRLDIDPWRDWSYRLREPLCGCWKPSLCFMKEQTRALNLGTISPAPKILAQAWWYMLLIKDLENCYKKKKSFQNIAKKYTRAI